METWKAEVQTTCHGNWGAAGQNLQCSLNDILFNSRYIAQLFDWQNIIYLFFFPLMLLIAATIFRATFRIFGAKDLGEVIKNAGGIRPIEREMTGTEMTGIRPARPGQPLRGNLTRYEEQDGMMYVGQAFGVDSASDVVYGQSFGDDHQTVLQPMQYLTVQQQQPQYATVQQPLQMAQYVQPMPQPVQYVGLSFTPPSPHVTSRVEVHHVPVTQVVEVEVERPLIQRGAPSVELVDVDRRNIAVMIAMTGFIWSIGLICWASITQFVNPSSPDAMYYQGFATQHLEKGMNLRGKNIGWALFWLVFGSILMSLAQILIKFFMQLKGIDMVHMVVNDGNIAVAIYEAGLQVSLGLIVGACISGPPGMGAEGDEGTKLAFDIAGVMIYFCLGALLLVLWGFVFDFMISKWDLWVELKTGISAHGKGKYGNEAAAISMFFQMICSAYLMANAISKSFELVTFFGWFATGTFIRMWFRTLLDYVVIAPIHVFMKPNYTFAQLSIDSMIANNNWGVAVIAGLLQLSITNIINSFLPGFCQDFVYSDGRQVGMLTFVEKLRATEYVMTIWQWDRLIACLIIFAFIVVATPVYRMRLLFHAWREASRNPHLPKLNSDINFYIFEKGQSAVCISYGAFLMAVGNMMAGVFRDANYGTSFAKLEGPDAGQSWGLLLAQITIGLVGVVLSLLINDRFVLHKFDNMDEMMRNNNVAVALVEAGSLIGSSFIIEANINGWDYSDPPYASTVIFFFATQVLMVVFQLAYEAVTAFDDEQEVQLGNGAAGLFNGLNLVAVGLLLARCVYLSHSLITLVCWVGCTYVLLFLSERLINRIVFPELGFEACIRTLDMTVTSGQDRAQQQHQRRRSKHGNWGVAILMGICTICFVNLMCTFLRDCVFTNGIPMLVQVVT